MPSQETAHRAVNELQELLEENPEILTELDADLIRVCEELEVI
jgi:hypothetical protein